MFSLMRLKQKHRVSITSWGAYVRDWLWGLGQLDDSIPHPKEGCQKSGLSLEVCLVVCKLEIVTRPYPDPRGLETHVKSCIYPLDIFHFNITNINVTQMLTTSFNIWKFQMFPTMWTQQSFFRLKKITFPRAFHDSTVMETAAAFAAGKGLNRNLSLF